MKKMRERSFGIILSQTDKNRNGTYRVQYREKRDKMGK
jgi:hypothetical protein